MPITKFTLTAPAIGYKKDITLKVLEPFRIDLKAKNSDIKNGIFGFDKIPGNYKSICKSDIEKLRQEYKPIADVLDKEYLPPWLSIRKGQTVELELVWTKKRRANEYTDVAFETHPDFTITPTDLKDASKIQITCKNNNQNATQLLIKADNELTVGALNIFYPKPKTIDLEWCFVEITGDEKDEKTLEGKIKKTDLEDYLQKGLNPALVDVNITNNDATLVDISEHLENFKKHGFIKEHSKTGSYIERSKKETVLSYIANKHKEDTNKITVYFINQKCINKEDIKEDGTFKVSGGISPTGKGIAYLVLDDGGNVKSKNIVHEVMHALGLKHTFNGAEHEFKKTKTDNYMDYENTKTHTFKWQWQKLQEYSKLI